HRRDVVETIGVGEDLRPGPALAHLLEAAVQVADLDVGLEDALAAELEDDAHRAVHGRVRRAHVEQHRLGGQLELALVDVEIEGLHQFSSSPWAGSAWVWRPKLMPSSGPKGGSLPTVPSRKGTSG